MQLQVFLDDDTEYAHTVTARRRFRYARRAIIGAEAHLSQLDPRLTEIRERFVDAQYHVNSGSKRIRDNIGTVIREACVTHGEDHYMVTKLRRFQSTQTTIGRVSKAFKQIDQAKRSVEVLRRTGSDVGYLIAMHQLAGRYQRVGRYTDMVATYDSLLDELERLDLSEEDADLIVAEVNVEFFAHGEIARALPLFKAQWEKRRRQRSGAVSVPELLMEGSSHIALAQCHLSKGEAAAAEKVLRELLRQIALHEGTKDYKRLNRLRHRTIHVLGAALFKQGRVTEAKEKFEEACDLLDASGTADEKMIQIYRNSRIYSSTRLHDERT